jgi:hypothetical protein
MNLSAFTLPRSKATEKIPTRAVHKHYNKTLSHKLNIGLN